MAERVHEEALHLTQKADFTVRDIVVDGRRYTDRGELFAALGVGPGAAILAFDPAAALARVRQLPWVASAVVERQLPDMIVVRLVERVPMARWQHDNKTVVIDSEGKELPHAKPEGFLQLPLVVGPDAPEHTQELLDMLKAYPTLASLVRAATRVGARRWDLYVQPKLLVRLPEENTDAALAKLVGLIQNDKLLERNLVAVDLRLADRMILEPADTGDTRP